MLLNEEHAVTEIFIIKTNTDVHTIYTNEQRNAHSGNYVTLSFYYLIVAIYTVNIYIVVMECLSTNTPSQTLTLLKHFLKPKIEFI